MARLNLKLLLCLVVAMMASTWVTYMWKCGLPTLNGHRQPVASVPDPIWIRQGGKSYKELDCSINGLFRVSCRKEDGDSGEVFVPFSFLEKYYEVYGKLVTTKAGREVFEWSHSYSKVYKPAGKYNSSGSFMHFANYNVEIRDRVKCISATEGVPVSTQWEASGYYYPVQVAQYGLSHYSKNQTESPPAKRKILEDGQDVGGKWQVPRGAYVKRLFDQDVQSNLIEFNSRDTNGITLRLKPLQDVVLSLDIRLEGSNSSMTIWLEDRDRSQSFPVVFSCATTTLIESFNSTGNVSTIYGMGPCGKWAKLSRDLFIDLVKGHVLAGRGKKLIRTKLRLLNMTLKGTGRLDNLTVSSSDHPGMFYSSADWLVRHQDPNGGWPIGVKRKLAAGKADLAPGWYSAMGQGQAMSLLMRAFHHSGDRKYLEAAVKGMRPFSVSSADGGVRAYFMNQHPFYEEYPTTPPSFVLNGFIYSLIGLYDVISLADAGARDDARLLYDQGMATLKKLLPLYDTGSGSVYDLRHFTLGLPPNIARWDYHSTHVNQLLLLSTIDPDPILSSVAERWLGYMHNKRAAHN